MNARVIFSDVVLQQTGSVGKILMYIQDNPVQCRDTNVTKLANCMSLAGVMSKATAAIVITKMLNNQMLTRYNGIRRCSFAINYFHKDIPGYILDRADAKTKEKVLEWKNSIKAGQRLTDDGCIITKVEKEEKENTITANEKDEPANLPAKVEKEDIVSSSDISEENTTSVPVTIRDTERGLSISITLNLNINK